GGRGAMTNHTVSLYEFMPYGAPELREVARKYMVRGVSVATAAWIVVYLLSMGTNLILTHRKPHETSVIIVPYLELAAPPPPSQNTPSPQVNVATPVAPATAAGP